jgi:hypothetical protein
MIGRLYFASINEGERYYLRLLLLNRKGATSFDDLKTVDDITHRTFRLAAQALGLLVSDRHYHQSMSEAALWKTGYSLRFMFCMILLHSPPSDPLNLLMTFIDPLSNNLSHQLRTRYAVAQPSHELRKSLCYYLIQQILNEHNKTLSNVGLDSIVIDPELADLFSCVSPDHLLSIRDHARLFCAMSSSLNERQTIILETIIQLTDQSESGLIYIDGPGGTGKTYLMNVIIHYLSASECPVITVASSGVAGLMLVNGMTAHSLFKIPLDISATTQCNWNYRSPMADLMRGARVVIWDEISMQSRYAVEAVDRAFRDLLELDEPFADKVVIFGGDFRQTLPVAPGGTIFDQASICMINSQLWRQVYRFQLTENLRLANNSDASITQTNADFYSWLLSVGSGSSQREFTEDINIQYGNVFRHSSVDCVLRYAISAAYDQLQSLSLLDDLDPLAEYYSGRLILAPLNSDITRINNICSDQFPGSYHISHLIDSMASDDEGMDSDEAIPEEVLKTFCFPGFPASQLKLKVGMPVILLRNLNLSRGLSNGNRLLVRAVADHVICCRILTGSRVGDDVMIPKIDLKHRANHVYGVSFSRYRFPVSPAFALTINKAQGQSLSCVSVYLPQPVFGHGQLYVALSRVTNLAGLTISMVGDPNTPPKTTNVVNLDVIRRCFRATQVSLLGFQLLSSPALKLTQ